MNITKEAMNLFMQSLPVGSKFEIIGFGSKYECMGNEKAFYNYNDYTLNVAKH
jgi:hypothetical protein